MSKTYFTNDHEWLSVENGVATVGLTNYAQEQLGDFVFVDLPAVGKAFEKGEVAVVVESVKAASDVYAPVSGEVNEINTKVAEEPSLINSAGESDGWLWKMTVVDEGELEGLMDAAAYRETLA